MIQFIAAQEGMSTGVGSRGNGQWMNVVIDDSLPLVEGERYVYRMSHRNTDTEWHCLVYRESNLGTGDRPRVRVIHIV